MFNRQLLADASLALMLALPTLALPAPSNPATELPSEPMAVTAEAPVERLAAAARAADPQRVRS